MIRKTKNKKNPQSGLLTTKIQPKNGMYIISVFIEGTPVRIIENIKNKNIAEEVVDEINKKTQKELQSVKKRNPDYELEPSLRKAMGSSIAIPDNKMEAFELGRLYGIQTSVKKYCGALNFLKRRKVLKAVDDAISNSLSTLARTVLVRGEGIEGSVPFVTKRKSS